MKEPIATPTMTTSTSPTAPASPFGFSSATWEVLLEVREVEHATLARDAVSLVAPRLGRDFRRARRLRALRHDDGRDPPPGRPEPARGAIRGDSLGLPLLQVES